MKVSQVGKGGLPPLDSLGSTFEFSHGLGSGRVLSVEKTRPLPQAVLTSPLTATWYLLSGVIEQLNQNRPASFN